MLQQVRQRLGLTAEALVSDGTDLGQDRDPRSATPGDDLAALFGTGRREPGPTGPLLLAAAPKGTGTIQLSHLGVGEHARAGDKADSLRALEGKAGAAAGNHVDHQLAVGEEGVLLAPHPERAIPDAAQANIDGADLELAGGITHG